jgi:hypothetical protein
MVRQLILPPLSMIHYFFSFVLLFGCYTTQAQTLSLFFGDTLFIEPGTTASIDLKVIGFKQIASFNIALQYDTAIFRITSATPQNLTNAFPNVGNTTVDVIWSSPTGIPITISDSTSILRLEIESGQNFTAIGKIQFALQPFPSEFFGFDGIQFFPIDLMLSEAVIVVRECATSLDLGTNQSICLGDSITLYPICQNCRITWPDSTHTNFFVTDQPGWIIAQAEGPLRCYATDSVQIIQSPKPAFSLPSTLTKCANQPLILTPISVIVGQYAWSDSSTTPAINIPAAGQYTLTITNSFNCSATDSTLVTQNSPPNLTIDTQQPNCKMPIGSIQFDNVQGTNAPYMYSVDAGNNFQTNKQFSGLSPAAYFTAVQDIDGCLFMTDTVLLNPAFIPQINLSDTPIVLTIGDSTTLQAQLPPNFPIQQVATVQWSPMDNLTFGGNNISELLQPNLKPIVSGQYTVTLQTKDGCTVSDSIFVALTRTDPIQWYIPNAISPQSNDGNNQVSVYSKDDRIEKISYFAIFDRWGELVYKKNELTLNNLEQGWDGRSSGRIVAQGVYIWVVEFALIDGSKIQKSGEVTVIH